MNVLGLHNTVTAWMKSQPDSRKPEGTVINVSSGLEGIVQPGMSAYSSSKLAGHRYMEFVATGTWLYRSTCMSGLLANHSAQNTRRSARLH